MNDRAEGKQFSLNRSSSDNPPKSEKEASLSLKDKIWIALAVAVFVIAFAIILIYGVFLIRIFSLPSLKAYLRKANLE